jgi:hypothetical protein
MQDNVKWDPFRTIGSPKGNEIHGHKCFAILNYPRNKIRNAAFTLLWVKKASHLIFNDWNF